MPSGCGCRPGVPRRRAAGNDTEITTLTAPYGVAYIETRSEAAVGAMAVLEMIAEHDGTCDAATTGGLTLQASANAGQQSAHGRAVS